MVMNSSTHDHQDEEQFEKQVRERDERLIQMMREKQEHRLLLASLPEENNQSLWHKLFRRK